MEPNSLAGWRTLRICSKTVTLLISLKRFDWKEQCATKQTGDLVPPTTKVFGTMLSLKLDGATLCGKREANPHMQSSDTAKLTQSSGHI